MCINSFAAVNGKFGHPWGCPPPKREKTCPRSGRTAVQNFMMIGKAPAEKSVTVHATKEINSTLSIPPCTTYGGIIITFQSNRPHACK